MSRFDLHMTLPQINHINPIQYPWLDANHAVIVDVIDRLNDGRFGSIKDIDWAIPAFHMNLDKPNKWRVIGLQFHIYGREPAKVTVRVFKRQMTVFASYPPEEQAFIAGEKE